MIVVVSPHLDDAVLSLGQWLAFGQPEAVTILTVFAGIPEHNFPVTHYDVQCGYGSAREAMRARRRENEHACSVLDVTPCDLDFLDQQYGLPVDQEALRVELQDAFDELDASPVVVPLGLVHDDHRVVCDRAREAAEGRRILAYEELPYRVNEPRSVDARLGELEKQGVCAREYPITQGSRALKVAALGCYRSQIPDPTAPELLVGERMWELT